MGCHPNISHDRFPRQGDFLDRRVKVMFNYGGPEFEGVVVRDDIEEPGLAIIRLDDGRHVMTTECQYSLAALPAA